jgi:predicted hydrolase (HD superfamily)
MPLSHDRDAAWSLLAEFTPSQALRRHALSVEATMRELARSRGVADPEEIATWGVVGLLHDFDFERFPTEQDHVWRGMEILRERAWPEVVIRGVGAHALYTGIERVSAMEKAILAADELSGFVGACALVRPSRRVADVPVASVLKRMKEKAFARTVDRAYVTRGAEEWGLPLEALVALVLRAQVPVAAALGLDGSPAPELPDAPAPPVPPAP